MQRALPPAFQVGDAKAFLGRNYEAPTKFLQYLEQSGTLLRLKRGLYAFAQDFDRLAVAGAIHGPSYVSFETALGYYGLIPERVNSVMSVVDGRPARFMTPIGLYEYHAQERRLFAEGMGLVELAAGSCLMATREKALLDTIARAQLRAALFSPEQVLEFVTMDLRVDDNQLESLSVRKLQRMAKLYRNLGPSKLVQALQARRNNHE